MAPSQEASLFVDYMHSLFHHLSEHKSFLCYTVYLHDVCRSFFKDTHTHTRAPQLGHPLLHQCLQTLSVN